MSGAVDYKVRPRKWDEIDNMAYGLRKVLGLEKKSKFPIIPLLEQALDYQLGQLRFEVGDTQEMGAAEGYTCPNGEFIRLREDVYEGALAGNPRDIFTAAHELGHFVLHRGLKMQPLQRSTRAAVPAYMLAEPQANQYAASLLMPENLVNHSDSCEQIVERFGVSFSAAENRISYLKRKGVL